MESDLSIGIERALEDSAYLVVVCSPDAARSHWVDEEIRRFRTLHGSERILSVIVGGRPSRSEDNCFPPALRDHATPDGGADQVSPLAADLRAGAMDGE